MAQRTNRKRSKQFELPVGLLSEFFDKVNDEALDAELIEVDDDGDLVVKINYDESERDAVMNLVETVDDYFDDHAEEEDED